MKRNRGFSVVHLAMGLVALGLIAAIVLAVRGYLDNVRDEAYKAGRASALLEVAQRDNKALAEATRAIVALHKEKERLEAAHAAQVAKADADGRREIANVEARKERFIADVTAGRIRLFDPGRRADAACPGGGDGAAPTAVAAAGVGDGARAGELSGQTAQFLLGEAARADAVVVKLTAAQKLIQACHAQGASP